MIFSERMGYKPVREQLQIEGMDDRLKMNLWNFFITLYDHQINPQVSNDKINFLENLWASFFIKPLDEAPFSRVLGIINDAEVKGRIKNYFFDPNRKWFEVYDFIEFIAEHAKSNYIKNHVALNQLLSEEKAGYTFIEKQLVPITSKEEIQSIEEAVDNTKDKYKGVHTHLQTALSLLSDRENPDYRNSIKESISAVESLCKTLVGNDKAKLSHALKLLKEQHNAHPALLEAFNNLYGYTSDGDGIRHAIMKDGKELDFHDAKYMLVTCTAFINLMIGKLDTKLKQV